MIRASIILSIAIIAATSIYVYNTPYNTCAREAAPLVCARLLGGAH